jgi:hypothetical protein
MDARRLGDIAAELEKIESPDFWLDVDPQSGAPLVYLGAWVRAL